MKKKKVHPVAHGQTVPCPLRHQFMLTIPAQTKVVGVASWTLRIYNMTIYTSVQTEKKADKDALVPEVVTEPLVNDLLVGVTV